MAPSHATRPVPPVPVAPRASAWREHFGRIHRQVTGRQVALARIGAPTGAERRRADYVRDALAAGVAHAPRDGDDATPRVTLDAAGNVVARRAGRWAHAAPILVVAHLDTVFDAVAEPTLRREGTRLLCPGIGDNARGLAAMLAIAKAFGRRPATGRPVEFVATVGEEGFGNLRGMRARLDAMAADGETPAAVLVLDGPGDDRIVHHAVGSRRYRIAVRGPGGHSWADYGAANAVHAVARAVHWMTAIPRTLPGSAALTVSGIGGGERVNGIPESAWCEVDLRAADATVLERADRAIRDAVAAAVREEPAADTLVADVALLGERPAGALAASHPLVRLAADATRAVGRVPIPAIASTDANVPLSRRIPAITIGAGGVGGGAHTLDEWYEDRDGALGLARAATIAESLAEAPIGALGER